MGEMSKLGKRHPDKGCPMHRKILSSLVLAVLCGWSGCLSAPVYTGPPSPHFDGTHFLNRSPADKTAWDLVRVSFGFLYQAEKWPDWIEEPPQQIARLRIPHGNAISVTFVNHSTVLIQVDELNILTDPIYALRASPFQWAGPKRIRAPGVRLEDLPPIDVILISHNHYDHLDIDTLQKIQALNSQDGGPLILAGLGNGQLFAENGLNHYRDMDWGERLTHKTVKFIFTQAQHRSGRGIADQMKTLWGSFVIQTSHGNIYFGGDTGYGPHFKEARKAYGSFALSLLPIGAYEPRWMMGDIHLNPREAVQAHLDLGSQQSVGIHFGTFQLTYEGVDQPRLDLAKARQDLHVPDDQFWTLQFGETREISHSRKVKAPDV